MSYDGNAQSQLCDAFGPSVAEHEDCMTECLSLLRLYSLTPQDLFYKFEAFALTSLTPASQAKPTLHDFRALRQHLQSTLASAGSSGMSPAAVQTPKKDYLGTNFASTGSSASGSSRKLTGLGGLASKTAAGNLQTPSRPSALSRGHGGGQHERPALASTSQVDDSPSRDGGSGTSSRTFQPWKAIQTLNSSIPASTGVESKSASSRVALAVGTDPRKWQYRYMFERGGERGEALDDLLESYSALLIEAYGINEEDMGDPSHTHQQSVYVVGRICPSLNVSSKNADATATGLPRLKPSTDGILIESSKLQGAGARVPVRFEKDCILRRPPGMEDEDEMARTSPAELLGIFPGMIVGLKGRNGGGDGFGCEEVLLLPPLYQPSTPPSRLLELQHGSAHLRGLPLNVALASGPFTSDSNLDFSPWHTLMDNLQREPVDVLVLLGPFIPLSHPQLATSKHLPHELFQRHFASRLNALTSSGGGSAATTPILIPSVLDSLSSHAAWPQPKYDLTELGLTKKSKLLPNPCLFSINEVVIGVSTADVLRDIRSEELVLRLKAAGQKASNASQPPTQKEDVLARAVRHVLSQRSFYPLFPPPIPRAATASSGSEDAAPLPLSLPHLELSLWPTVTPDVLILPSHLEPFAKIVDGVIVLNSGRVADVPDANPAPPGASSVNLARLCVQPLNRKMLESEQEAGDEARAHDVWERTRVDLLSL